MRPDRMINLALKICYSRHQSGGAIFVKASGKVSSYYNMACVISRNGKILSIGQNVYGAVPGSKIYKNFPKGCGIHAEIAAILNIRGEDNKDYKKMELYVSGLTKGGNLVCSKPCEFCQSVILSLGFKKIFYHDKLGNVKELA